MTGKDYQKKIDAGFDESKINNYYSIMLLMNRTQEQLTIEIQEYLAEYDMHTMNVKHELKGIAGRVNHMAEKIMPTFKNTKENQLNFFDDYDGFVKLVKSFMVAGGQCKSSKDGE